MPQCPKFFHSRIQNGNFHDRVWRSSRCSAKGNSGEFCVQKPSTSAAGPDLRLLRWRPWRRTRALPNWPTCCLSISYSKRRSIRTWFDCWVLAQRRARQSTSSSNSPNSVPYGKWAPWYIYGYSGRDVIRCYLRPFRFTSFLALSTAASSAPAGSESTQIVRHVCRNWLRQRAHGVRDFAEIRRICRHMGVFLHFLHTDGCVDLCRFCGGLTDDWIIQDTVKKFRNLFHWLCICRTMDLSRMSLIIPYII